MATAAVVLLWARPAHEPPAPPGAAAAPSPVTSLSLTDIGFLQLMISLDASALPLLDLITATGDPVLTPVAGAATESHRGELDTLRVALRDGGVVEDPTLHAGHDLPGMVLDQDLAAIRALPAAQQPAQALAVLREHLTATSALATSEGTAGADPATKAVAAKILDAHTALLNRLPAV